MEQTRSPELPIDPNREIADYLGKLAVSAGAAGLEVDPAVIRAQIERRSYRSFKPDVPVPGVVIDTLEDIVRLSPSSKNAGPWYVLAVTGREELDAIADQLVATRRGGDKNVPTSSATGEQLDSEDTSTPSAEVLRTAPAALVIGNRSPFTNHANSPEEPTSAFKALKNADPATRARAIPGLAHELIGVGGASYALSLALKAFEHPEHGKLGCVYMGDFYGTEIKGVDKDVDVLAVMAIGFPDMPPPPRTLDERKRGVFIREGAPR